MTPLHLARIPLRTDALGFWARERGLGSVRPGADFDEGRAIHHLLAEVLGPRAVHCFRLLVPPRQSEGSLYLYSPMAADALKAAADCCAWPEHLDVLPLARLKSRPMPGTWAAGHRLGFDLRARPIRRLRRDLDGLRGRFSRGAELDVYLIEALQRFPDAPGGMAKERRTREAVYLDWLEERLAAIASLDRPACRLARFRRARILRANRRLEGPDATIHGTLTVSEPDRFGELLRRGVGRHRAYGYGMLLLRPPGKPVPGR